MIPTFIFLFDDTALTLFPFSYLDVIRQRYFYHQTGFKSLAAELLTVEIVKPKSFKNPFHPKQSLSFA